MKSRTEHAQKWVSNHSTLMQRVSDIVLKTFIQINCSELLQTTTSCTHVIFLEDDVKHGFM